QISDDGFTRLWQ
ncbi:hypothetical protein VCHENC02_3234B, partial [Vibrio harveyi]